MLSQVILKDLSYKKQHYNKNLNNNYWKDQLKNLLKNKI